MPAKKRKGRTARTRSALSRSASTSNFNGHDDNARIFELLRWMGSKGFSCVTRMKPKHFDGTGRGLMLAEKSLTPNDEIVRIPESLLITKDVALSALVDDGIEKEKLLRLSCLEILTMFLMREISLRDNSKWLEYLLTLPQHFSLPYFHFHSFSDYAPKSLINAIARERKVFDESFSNVRVLIPSVSLEEFKFAWSAVNTRCVFTKGSASESEAALAPFLDLLNHNPSAKTSAEFDEAEGSYILRTLVPFKQFEQVFINYGAHCNRKLFINYGFVVPSNPLMSIEVNEDLLKSICDHYAFRRAIELLNETSLTSESQSEFQITRDGLDWALDTLLKVIAFNETHRSKEYEVKEALFKHDLTLDESSSQRYTQIKNAVVERLLEEYLQFENVRSDCDEIEDMLKTILRDEKQLLESLLT